MKNTNPDQVVQAWAQRGAAAADAVKAGVNAVTENPAAKAAAQVDVWANNVMKAKQKFVDSLNRVSLADWKRAMLSKGIDNMSAGYSSQVNQAKFLAFMRVFLPYVRNEAARIRMMPKGDLQKGIDRAVAMIKANAAFRQQRGGGGAAWNPIG